MGHMAGWRFEFFRFGRYSPLSSLRIRWSAAKSKKAAYAAKGQILFEYVEQHGELPPLNYKFNWNEWEAMNNYFDAISVDGDDLEIRKMGL